MFKKNLMFIAIFSISLIPIGSLWAGSGINMITGDDLAAQYQTQLKDGAVEWQGPEVTVRVIENEVFVIKNGATIKISNGLVEVSGGESLQVRKVDAARGVQEMGGGINMLNGQALQGGGINMLKAQTNQEGGGIDMNTAPVNATSVTPASVTHDTSFTGKFFRKLGIE